MKWSERIKRKEQEQEALSNALDELLETEAFELPEWYYE